MIQFEHTTEINRTPREVFELMSDVTRAPAWQRSVLSVVQATPGAVRVGTEFHEVVKGPAGRTAATVRVAVHRPGELIAFAGDAGFADYYCAFELAPTGNGSTHLVARTEFRLHRLWNLLRPLIAREMHREITGELAALKRVLETGVEVRAAAG